MIYCVGCLSEPGEEGLADGTEEAATESPDQLAEETSTTTQASVAEGFVAGAGVIETDDFGDEGPVDSSSRRFSMATGLWQAILWADGAIESSDIDCDFGPNTTAATRNWQRTRGLEADGSAGPKTFGRADDKLERIPVDATFSFVVYDGSAHDLFLIRKEGSGSSNHAYQAIATDGTLRIVFYRFISSCSSSFWLG